MRSELLASRLALLLTVVFIALGVAGVAQSRSTEGAVTADEAVDEVEELIDRAMAHDAEGVCSVAFDRQICLDQLAKAEPSRRWPEARPTVASVAGKNAVQHVTMSWIDPVAGRKQSRMIVVRRGAKGLVLAGPIFWVVHSAG